MELTRGLLIVSLLVWLVPARAMVNGDGLAVLVGAPVTSTVWAFTALRLRANLNDRGGYLNDH